MPVKRGPWNTVSGLGSAEAANLLRELAEDVAAGRDVSGVIVVTHRPKGGAREFEMHCEGSTKRGALAVLALHKALNFFTR